MDDREKAIRILEGNYKNFVLRHNGELLTVNELIALLKAQQPRVMTLEEVQSAEVVWIEQIGKIVPATKVYTYQDGIGTMEFAYPYEGSTHLVHIRPDYYGKISRCWTSRPTDEQREATPWNN